MARFVGLDVHKRVVEACILDEVGKVGLRHRFDPQNGGLEPIPFNGLEVKGASWQAGFATTQH
jgi:hypothetical protein